MDSLKVILRCWNQMSELDTEYTLNDNVASESKLLSASDL